MKRAGRGPLLTLVVARLLLRDAVARTAINGGGGVACSAKLTFAHYVRAPQIAGNVAAARKYHHAQVPNADAGRSIAGDDISEEFFDR